MRERGSDTYRSMQDAFGPDTARIRASMEIGSNETIKQAVMADMGLSFLSLHTLQLELEKQLLVVLDVEGSPVLRAWNVVHTLSKLLSPAAEAFRYFMLERGEAFLARNFAAHLALVQPASANSPCSQPFPR